MIKRTPDYTRYFAFTPEMERWGLGITAAGRSPIPAGADYPEKTHPSDHFFDWDHGRTLDAFQVVLITAGQGWFETKPTGLREVRTGMLFLILPGLWHRYRPDPDTGWTESWIEVRGPVVESLVGSGVFPPSEIILEGAIRAGIEAQIEGIHRLLLHDGEHRAAAGSAAALQVLAACDGMRRGGFPAHKTADAVTRAERYLAEHHAGDLDLEELARGLGVAYSHFRRSFRDRTGLSPWQYVIRLRLSRARRLLASGDATLEDVALRVGFSSAFHFSHAFKKAFGIAPDPWRRSLKQDGKKTPPPDGESGGGG